MNTSIKPREYNENKIMNNKKLYEEVSNQLSFSQGKVRKRTKSSFFNKKTGNMPQDFGKLRPKKITHSRTMTP